MGATGNNSEASELSQWGVHGTRSHWFGRNEHVRFTGASMFRRAFHMTLIGGLAAGAAFIIALDHMTPRNIPSLQNQQPRPDPRSQQYEDSNGSFAASPARLCFPSRSYRAEFRVCIVGVTAATFLPVELEKWI